nr:transposase (putative), gypsy type [Tanacetum cinerariifolium]
MRSFQAAKWEYGTYKDGGYGKGMACCGKRGGKGGKRGDSRLAGNTMQCTVHKEYLHRRFTKSVSAGGSRGVSPWAAHEECLHRRVSTTRFQSKVLARASIRAFWLTRPEVSSREGARPKAVLSRSELGSIGGKVVLVGARLDRRGLDHRTLVRRVGCLVRTLNVVSSGVEDLSRPDSKVISSGVEDLSCPESKVVSSGAVIKHFKVYISQLVPLGLSNVITLEILCRNLNMKSIVTLFRVFQTLFKQGDWFSFAKREDPAPVYMKGVKSRLKLWVPTSFNQGHVDQLKAHIVKLCDIPKASLRIGKELVYFAPSPYYMRYPYDEGLSSNPPNLKKELFKDPKVCKTILDRVPTPTQLLRVEGLTLKELSDHMNVLMCTRFIGTPLWSDNMTGFQLDANNQPIILRSKTFIIVHVDEREAQLLVYVEHLSAELAKPKEVNNALEKASHNLCENYKKYKAQAHSHKLVTQDLEKERLENELLEILAASKQDTESFDKAKIAPSLQSRYGTTAPEEIWYHRSRGGHELTIESALTKDCTFTPGYIWYHRSRGGHELTRESAIIKDCTLTPGNVVMVYVHSATDVASHLVAYTREKKGGYFRPFAAESVSKDIPIRKRSEKRLSPLSKGSSTPGGGRTTSKEDVRSSHSFHQKDGSARIVLDERINEYAHEVRVIGCDSKLPLGKTAGQTSDLAIHALILTRLDLLRNEYGTSVYQMSGYLPMNDMRRHFLNKSSGTSNSSQRCYNVSLLFIAQVVSLPPDETPSYYQPLLKASRLLKDKSIVRAKLSSRGSTSVAGMCQTWSSGSKLSSCSEYCSLPPGESGSSLPSEGTSYFLPLEGSSYSLHSEETGCSLPSEETSYSLPSEKTDCSLPSEETSYSLHPEKTNCSLPPKRTSYSLPPEETSYSLPPEKTSCSLTS